MEEFLCGLVCHTCCLRPQLHHSDLLSAVQRVLSMPGWSFHKPTIIKVMNDPLILWDQFATSVNLDPATRSNISDELASSVRWQAYSYDHPPRAPTLLYSSIDWEQSIVEGHPTHPVRALFLFTRRKLTDEIRCTKHVNFYLQYPL
jgi:hypothetical protein